MDIVTLVVFMVFLIPQRERIRHGWQLHRLQCERVLTKRGALTFSSVHSVALIPPIMVPLIEARVPIPVPS